MEAEPLQLRARNRGGLTAGDAPAQGGEVSAPLGQEPAVQVVPVAGGGAGRPARHYGQRPGVGRIGLVQLFQLVGQIGKGEVVGGPFQHRPVERAHRLLQFHESGHHLVLQHLGVGGDPHGDLPAGAGPGQRRRRGQIGQGLAGAGGGFDKAVRSLGQRVRHLAGHLLLLGPVVPVVATGRPHSAGGGRWSMIASRLRLVIAVRWAHQHPVFGQRGRRLGRVERAGKARRFSGRWQRGQRRRQRRGLGRRRGQQICPGVAGPMQQPALQVAVGPVGVQEIQQFQHHSGRGLGVGQGPVAGLRRRDSQMPAQVVQGEAGGRGAAVGVGGDRPSRAGEGQQGQLQAVEPGSASSRTRRPR